MSKYDFFVCVSMWTCFFSLVEYYENGSITCGFFMTILQNTLILLLDVYRYLCALC